jgi:hypothetical protein
VQGKSVLGTSSPRMVTNITTLRIRIDFGDDQSEKVTISISDQSPGLSASQNSGIETTHRMYPCWKDSVAVVPVGGETRIVSDYVLRDNRCRSNTYRTTECFFTIVELLLVKECLNARNEQRHQTWYIF